jgi:hypothetical protein
LYERLASRSSAPMAWPPLPEPPRIDLTMVRRHEYPPPHDQGRPGTGPPQGATGKSSVILPYGPPVAGGHRQNVQFETAPAMENPLISAMPGPPIARP